jgi:hypothetical protein
VTPETLTNLINWVGVGTGLVGALVVAPSGPVELARMGGDLLRLIAAAARRVLPRNRGESVFALAGVATASASVDTLVVRKEVSDHGPIADQVARLIQAVNQLNEDLNKTQQDYRAEDGKLREAIGRVEQGVQQADDDIRQKMTAADVSRPISMPAEFPSSR